MTLARTVRTLSCPVYISCQIQCYSYGVIEITRALKSILEQEFSTRGEGNIRVSEGERGDPNC